MTLLDQALSFKKGFYVFPIAPGRKTPPAIENWPERATLDPDQIKKWWGINSNYNIGIYTGKYNGDGEALLVVDVDNKGEKKGNEEIVKLELEGFLFPETFEQVTPTQGRHYVYRTTEAVKQGVNVLGPGLDIRSRGGYIVGSGSSIEGKPYTSISRSLGQAPEWLISRCGRVAQRKLIQRLPLVGLDRERALSSGQHYLEAEAPLAVEGAGGDQGTYAVACRVKDFGVTLDECLNLMSEFWNPRCSPPWDEEELRIKIENAYQYGSEAPGASAPEVEFSEPIDIPSNEHPIKKLNNEYAFVVAGGGAHILWETKNHKDRKTLEHLGITTFHQKLASQFIEFGDGQKPISQLWMKSQDRRSYDGIVFMPGGKAPERFYNLWQGFAYTFPKLGEQFPMIAHQAVERYLEHALLNICKNDKDHFQWLIGYFAHMIQKPGEKPLVATVFRGARGVGKNAFITPLGRLLGAHYLLTSDKRYLTGNFNGHLENLILFALDEAFWSGDKQAEGTLKNLITGDSHVIEHKGHEPYTVDNFARIVIIGNEDWIVPAAHDERRFAVFNVGSGNKQDKLYFKNMREGFEAGGYRLLLHYLMNFDISNIDINQAPSTAGLMEQKVSSLEPFYQWWLDCISAGKIVGSDFGDNWISEISKERLRGAFRRYSKDRNVRSRVHSDIAFSYLLLRCLPSVSLGRKQTEGERIKTYKIPELAQCRKEWDTFIGHPTLWENENASP